MKLIHEIMEQVPRGRQKNRINCISVNNGTGLRYPVNNGISLRIMLLPQLGILHVLYWEGGSQFHYLLNESRYFLNESHYFVNPTATMEGGEAS
jgi:hypothetical protein